MASLTSRVTDGFARVASEIKGSIRPRLIPKGGDTNYTLIKASKDDYNVGWAAPPRTHFVDVAAQDTSLYTPDGNTTFPRVKFNNLVRDDENLWSGPDNWYTVPENGLYLITASIRAPDNAGQFEFGFGVNNVQGDGPYFLWVFRPNANRWASPYNRMAYFDRGQQLRMFTYGYVTTVNAAGLQIGMISKSF